MTVKSENSTLSLKEVDAYGTKLGELAESWELITEPTVSATFHLRKGIMLTGKEMEPREVTADDVAFGLNRICDKEGYSKVDYADSATAIDRYTVRLDMNKYDASWAQLLGYGIVTGLTSPEMVAAGADFWQNAVGTGPFTLQNYVEGSYVSYERNPNYWRKTTINGKEYELPFIDKLTYLIIPDESTQIAALRTGKIDWYASTPILYDDTLAQTSLGLTRLKTLNGTAVLYRINVAAPGSKWSDVNLRRALWIGTDWGLIRDAVYGGEGDLHSCPLGRGLPEYTPMEELPQSCQELFDYNPEKARPDAHWAGADNVRAEIFKAFGYFNTESSRHMSEYVPYFRKKDQPELLERFGLGGGTFGTRGDIEKRRKKQDEELRQQISSGQKFPIGRSGEYASTIINSTETGMPSRINGNVKNNGLITNLLEGCCVEVPCLVDKRGIHPCNVGLMKHG